MFWQGGSISPCMFYLIGMEDIKSKLNTYSVNLSFTSTYSSYIPIFLSFLPHTCFLTLFLLDSASFRNIQHELIIILSCLCCVKQAQEELLFPKQSVFWFVYFLVEFRWRMKKKKEKSRIQKGKVLSLLYMI